MKINEIDKLKKNRTISSLNRFDNIKLYKHYSSKPLWIKEKQNSLTSVKHVYVFEETFCKQCLHFK